MDAMKARPCTGLQQTGLPLTRTEVPAVASSRRAEDWVRAAAGNLFDAECALHVARQSHVDAWIAAASDRLHDAVLEHDQALSARCAGASR
jgi:hypothetical protein